MNDRIPSVARLRESAADAALIRDLATDSKKRDVFNRLSEHLTRLANELEQATQPNNLDASHG